MPIRPPIKSSLYLPYGLYPPSCPRVTVYFKSAKKETEQSHSFIKIGWKRKKKFNSAVHIDEDTRKKRQDGALNYNWVFIPAELLLPFQQTLTKRRLYATKLALFARSGPFTALYNIFKVSFNSICTNNQDWMRIFEGLLLLCQIKLSQQKKYMCTHFNLQQAKQSKLH